MGRYIDDLKAYIFGFREIHWFVLWQHLILAKKGVHVFIYFSIYYIDSDRKVLQVLGMNLEGGEILGLWRGCERGNCWISAS
jgi:hypothetical protein